MELTNNQKKFLRRLAHNINPFVMIGLNGLSQAVIDELDTTMQKHEIIKLKIRVEKDKKQPIIDSILSHTNANIVQVIGNVLVIYRAFEDEPQIILPRK